MQQINRWIFVLTGCALSMSGFVRLWRADYTGMFGLIAAIVYFWWAYRPPLIRSRVWQWGMYIMGGAAMLAIIGSLYG